MQLVYPPKGLPQRKDYLLGRTTHPLGRTTPLRRTTPLKDYPLGKTTPLKGLPSQEELSPLPPPPEDYPYVFPISIKNYTIMSTLVITGKLE